MSSRIVLVALMATLAASAAGAEMRPWRLQAGAGVPFGLGICAEYAPPFSIGPLKPAVELRAGTVPPIGMKQDGADITIKDYLDIGIGLIAYVRDDRAGPYAGLGYDWSRLTLKADIPDENSMDPLPYTGTNDFSYRSVHAKAGWRWMWGRMTLAVEAGYGLAFFDGSLDVTLESEGRTAVRTIDMVWGGSSSLAHGWVAKLAAGVAL
jgi:hypothetical protein